MPTRNNLKFQSTPSAECKAMNTSLKSREKSWLSDKNCTTENYVVADVYFFFASTIALVCAAVFGQILTAKALAYAIFSRFHSTNV